MILRLIEYENGGIVEVYSTVDRTASDYKNVLACCVYFAQQGAKTLITPRFSETIGNPEYHKIYSSLEGTAYWGKCPDFCVNGIWYEHEGFDVSKDLINRKKQSDTFCYMLRRGIKQSSRLVVEDTGIGHNWAMRIIYNRVHLEKQNIREVYIKTATGLELLYKKEAD